jgi:hypothetical protein
MAYGHIAIISPYGHISHTAICQQKWPILVSMEQAIKMQQSGGGIKKIRATFQKL